MEKIRLSRRNEVKIADNLYVEGYDSSSAKWEQLSSEDIMSLTMSDILCKARSLVLRFSYLGKVYFLALSKDDADKIRRKYPNAVIVIPSQIVNFFRSDFNEGRGQLIEPIFNVFSVFGHETEIVR